MPIPITYRKSDSKLVNYDGQDIWANTGYILLNGLSDGTNFSLEPNEVAGQEVYTSATNTGTTLTAAIDRTYSMTFPISQIIEGNIYLSNTVGLSAGSGTYSTRIDVIYSINSTIIATTSGQTATTAAVPTGGATHRITTKTNIATPTIIKAGDVLNARVVVMAAHSSTTRTWYLFQDGENRATASGQPIIAPNEYNTSFKNASTLKLQVPLKIQQ